MRQAKLAQSSGLKSHTSEKKRDSSGNRKSPPFENEPKLCYARWAEEMDLNLTAINLQGRSAIVRLEGVPDVCPRCHKNVHPQNPYAAFLSERHIVQVIFRCTNQACQELFIGTYTKTSGYNETKKVTHSSPIFNLSYVQPMKPKKESLPEMISEISPSFVEIYNQSLAAETLELKQIVGIGLRKALEFLIKDFAISENTGAEDEIKKKWLGQCIEKYIEDTNVKECAKRAAWLGNDETHYMRKWEDKDIRDLKILVQLTVNWLHNVLLTKKYNTEMEQKQ